MELQAAQEFPVDAVRRTVHVELHRHFGIVDLRLVLVALLGRGMRVDPDRAATELARDDDVVAVDRALVDQVQLRLVEVDAVRRFSIADVGLVEAEFGFLLCPAHVIPQPDATVVFLQHAAVNAKARVGGVFPRGTNGHHRLRGLIGWIHRELHSVASGDEAIVDEKLLARSNIYRLHDTLVADPRFARPRFVLLDGLRLGNLWQLNQYAYGIDRRGDKTIPWP